MILKELSGTELMLLSRIKQVYGHMDEKPYRVDGLGIFDKYIEVHKADSALPTKTKRH